MLLALLRGTGPDGMVGMRPRRPLTERVELVRPLLRVDPADLLAYCRSESLPYARDASNADPAYRRNALRAALETLRDDFPHLDEAVARCAEILRDERDGSERGQMRAGLRSLLADRGANRDVTLERVDAAVRLLERGTAGPRLARPRHGAGGRVRATDALPAAVERILYRPEEIAAAVRRMAAEIADETIGEPLVLVPVLKGAATLAADLARALPATLDVRIDYLAVSSYGDSHRSSGRRPAGPGHRREHRGQARRHRRGHRGRGSDRPLRSAVARVAGSGIAAHLRPAR